MWGKLLGQAADTQVAFVKVYTDADDRVQSS